jgi:hypothetical protein
MNKTISLVGMFLFGSMLMLSSCYYDNEEELYEYYNQQNVCDTTAVSFANDIMPMIQGNCVTGCHVAGGSGNGIFENYAEVKAKVDNGSMNNRVVVARDMPPSGALTSCQILQMQAWILNGAPNN